MINLRRQRALRCACDVDIGKLPEYLKTVANVGIPVCVAQAIMANSLMSGSKSTRKRFMSQKASVAWSSISVSSSWWDPFWSIIHDGRWRRTTFAMQAPRMDRCIELCCFCSDYLARVAFGGGMQTVACMSIMFYVYEWV